MTEIGRRLAILTGTLALVISVLFGVYYGGQLILVCLRGLLAGIIFGTGGMLIGNLIEGYVKRAAKREVVRRALEKEVAEEIMAATESVETNEEIEETAAESAV